MRTGLDRNAWDSAVRSSYAQKNRNSSSVRSLEEIKDELTYWKNEQKNYSDQLFKEQGGVRIFTADKEKVKQLEEGMENARRNYKRVEEEYKNHPDYYEDKYWYDSGFEKGIKGIVDSTVATVPVVAKTAASAVKETESKMESEEYAAARQAEEMAWNKLNDYAASYFGSFDMIDQSELDRLSQEYQQATDYRKTLEKQYEQPVDLDSKSMKLMEEGNVGNLAHLYPFLGRDMMRKLAKKMMDDGDFDAMRDAAAFL